MRHARSRSPQALDSLHNYIWISRESQHSKHVSWTISFTVFNPHEAIDAVIRTFLCHPNLTSLSISPIITNPNPQSIHSPPCYLQPIPLPQAPRIPSRKCHSVNLANLSTTQPPSFSVVEKRVAGSPKKEKVRYKILSMIFNFVSLGSSPTPPFSSFGVRRSEFPESRGKSFWYFQRCVLLLKVTFFEVYLTWMIWKRVIILLGVSNCSRVVKGMDKMDCCADYMCSSQRGNLPSLAKKHEWGNQRGAPVIGLPV